MRARASQRDRGQSDGAIAIRRRVRRGPQLRLGHRAGQDDGQHDRGGGTGGRRGRERRGQRRDRQRQSVSAGAEVAQVEREADRIAGGSGGRLGGDEVRGECARATPPSIRTVAWEERRDYLPVSSRATVGGRQRAGPTDRDRQRPPTTTARGLPQSAGSPKRLQKCAARQVVRHRVTRVLLEGRRGRRAGRRRSSTTAAGCRPRSGCARTRTRRPGSAARASAQRWRGGGCAGRSRSRRR